MGTFNPALKFALGLSISAILVLVLHPQCVKSHGRLIEPPSRSTMWRYGFSTPPNYNDHELYCGGYSRMWHTNGGKCGICGDAWDLPRPRPNEAGGMYGKGVIARKYRMDQVIKVRVELTANHMGYFQFRVCPNNNKRKPASQACLDKHVLKNAMTKDTKYYPGPGTKVFEMHYQLPKGLTCTQCVFQWRYVAGNNWGVCKNGTGAVGCGPQEEFRACADVTITENDGSADDTPNTILDDEETNVISSTDFDSTNEVDVNDIDTELRKEVQFESVIIIALCSMLAVAIFFGVLFCYYLRGKVYLERLVAEKEWDLPNLPSVGSMKKPKMPHMPKLNHINWPLSNVQIKNLPQYFGRGNGETKVSASERPVSRKSVTTVSAPINIISSTNQAATGPTPRPTDQLQNQQHQRQQAQQPRAPPRGKKNPPPAIPDLPQVRASSPPNFATIAPRTTNATGRPSAPPPVVPPSSSSTSAAVLDVGTPTAVTVNGVTVSTSPSSRDPSETNGYLVPARLAMVQEDVPDSLESNKPPPLPSCPPPEFEDSSEQTPSLKSSSEV